LNSHSYEVRPRKDHRGFTLISDALPFGRLWYLEVDDAIGYAKHRSRSHDAVIRVYDAAGNVIETHEHRREPIKIVRPQAAADQIGPANTAFRRRRPRLPAPVGLVPS